MSKPPIIVIGGGFSGTMAAIRIADRLPGFPVILIEETGDPGPGLAYGSGDPSARLNVPAGGMSAYQEQPDHFLNHARTVLGDGVQAEEFLPRHIYGNYLRHCLDEARAKNPLLTTDARRVTDVIRNESSHGALVIFKDQSTLHASHVVLATGNQGSAFASSLWSQHTLPARHPESIAGVRKGESAIIIGSGLTMIDAVLDLDRRGQASEIHVVSRNGLLPREYSHPSDLEIPDLDHLPDSNLRISLRLFRKAIRDHEARGGNWRDIFQSIRSSTPSLWQELSPTDRTRFLRWLSPFWEVHRHQCPGETLAKVRALISSGKLVQHRGTIVTVEKSGHRFLLGLAPRQRHAPTRWLEADHLLDATGPARDIETIRHPLIRNLLRRGFIKPDVHHLGAEVSADYRAIGRDGRPSPFLHIIGPMLRARYFEATAVSELRLHAASLASRIRNTVHSSNGEIENPTAA